MKSINFGTQFGLVNKIWKLNIQKHKKLLTGINMLAVQILYKNFIVRKTNGYDKDYQDTNGLHNTTLHKSKLILQIKCM
jgi:hypothetical protein